MKKTIFFLVLIVLAVSVFSYDGVIHDFDTGMKIAKLEQKQLIVMFSDPGCYYCNLFTKSTLSDETVGRLLMAGYVFVEIYPSNEKTATLEIQGKEEKLTYNELYAAFGVKGTPTFWFFDETATSVTSLPGYSKPDFFVNVLRFLGEKAYKNGMSFADYTAQSHDYMGTHVVLNLSEEDAQYITENDPLAMNYSPKVTFDPFRIWITADSEIANELITKGAFRVILVDSPSSSTN
ncbi:MAG: thioredoxin fold domain-containing protein [Kosmotoga sp.]|uniref:thioredoxin family protein n=1 Tax=Kosmotoga sp. TaxID=1955248 RepID=UPI001D5A9DCF|nr:thioredoxin fold domain-containing protein [Kosmotoga sp.]MBO8166779.1 thioredoxin fold domain-containing protein [Kosmotoga sp.]